MQKPNLMQTINNLQKRTTSSPTKVISEAKYTEESTSKKPPSSSLLHLKTSSEFKENFGVVSARDMPL